ncbi:MAG: Hsp20 family protein [Rhodobacter sp.]|nr:Hsp20 family protein [Rhodobacter sp.]MCY4242579.1 Hsp20 family protein [Rhodobacter sp.]
MTKLGLGSHPHFLGFDRLERLMEQTTRSDSDGYPPYNIERKGSNAYRITLAVAGFSEADLNVTVEDRQLVVRGKHADEDGQRVFLHRGIAARRFQRTFALAEGVEVSGAWLEHGILHIKLERIEPEKNVQTIKIGRPKAGEPA